MSPAYQLHLPKRGNAFWREITDVLADGLSELGRQVRVVEDVVPRAVPGTVNVLVGPHEFFELGPHLSEDEMQAAVAVSACVVAEQPHSVWFERSLPWLWQCPLVLDLSSIGADALCALGVHARHLRLGYSPRLDHWHGVARVRHLDMAFLGSMTERRGRFFADAAPRLADARCELRFFDPAAPKHAGDPGYLAGSEKWTLLADSRVLLNIHRSDDPYFEWPRALEAMANGCVVVSEPSLDTSPFVAGKHLFVAPLDCLADYAQGVLADEKLRAAVADQAYDLLITQRRMSQQFVPMLDELDDLANTASSTMATSSPKAVPPSPTIALPVVPLRLEATPRFDRQVPRPATQVGRREVRDDVSVTPAWHDFRPEVSVVVTAYNQAPALPETIESILGSDGALIELIVVDDHSSDASVPTVRHHLDTVGWMPAAIVAKAAHEGRSAARNVGLEMARSDRALLVDGGDVVLPGGAMALRRALDRSGAAFAWGMLADHGATTGVHNYLAWDLPRLLVANYIPSFAMIRASAWQDVGGFDPAVEARLGGSEVYELWLRLAARGFVGEFEPSFVGSHRTDPRPSLPTDPSGPDLACPDPAVAHRWLRERFPTLPWPPLPWPPR